MDRRQFLFGLFPMTSFVKGQILTADELNSSLGEKAATADLANSANGSGSDLVANATKKVASIAALRALRVPQGSDAQTVILDGYASAGDGGGGVFQWFANSSQAADGGIYINPNGNAGNGRWVRADFNIFAPVNPCWYGADATGASSSSTEVQAAVDTGKAVDFGGPENTFLITQTITRIGKVMLSGRATIKSDVLTFKITDGSGSRVRDLKIMPVTTPYTIKRNTLTWSNTASDVVQSLEGYIPGGQDTDIWANIPQSEKDTNANIHPGIYFTVSSAAGGSDVEISGIQGRQVNLILEGYTDSSVHDCDFGAGALTYGGILIFNGVNRAYNSALLGFTLPRGVGNSVHNNKVKYATLCGITWFGNDDFACYGNISRYNGESGIKTYQYDGVAGPSESTNCINTNGRFFGNTTTDNYYDGHDVGTLNGVTWQYIYVGTTVTGNISERNRMTGFTTNGCNMVFVGNHANSNGTHGLSVIGTGHTVANNHARNNCTTGTTLLAQVFDIVVEGDDCISFNNNISNISAPSTYNYVHAGLNGGSPTSGHEGFDFGNYCDGGPSRISVLSVIPATKSDFRVGGSLIANGYLAAAKPTTVGVATYTVGAADYSLSCYTPSDCTITLPDPASYPGRVLKIRNTNSYAINSASANIGPIGGGAPTTAILPATVGKWCELQSDGSVWLTMAAN